MSEACVYGPPFKSSGAIQAIEKVSSSSEIIQIDNKDTQLLKGKNSCLTLDILEQFLIKKKQNPNNIINFCFDDPMYQIILASCYSHGKWVEKNERKAFVYYQKSAEMDNASGICGVGYCYDKGIGIEKDENKAFIYYQKSAEMGLAIGTYNVGCCYQNGIGVE
ncbi:hypothetical protein C2G38_2247160 [Gigaspora rosea]|uniref:HCP-like protein n=1 Tax=Gigaspora rosea TaxID=44941 RepID=A0A397V5L9_9GLOM|nr:hypothetical protein C2G38_2247160 [Gigaspora rosea]